MDLTRVTLPTFVLEPKSMLERITNFMSHPELLLPIPTVDDPEKRFVEVVRFYLSGFHILPPVSCFLTSLIVRVSRNPSTQSLENISLVNGSSMTEVRPCTLQNKSAIIRQCPRTSTCARNTISVLMALLSQSPSFLEIGISGDIC